MKTFIGFILLTILMAYGANENLKGRPIPDPCRKGMLDHCKADEDCKLNAHQLATWTRHQETMAEVCPIEE